MVLEFLADGFEEIEALTPVDILRRAGVEIRTAAVGKGLSKKVTGSHGITAEADLTMEEAKRLWDEGNVEMIVLPGGMPGAKHLDEDGDVDAIVREAPERGTVIAAICAAPMIPGKRGLLKGRHAVCYPGFEKYLEGAVLTGGRVETDGTYVTGCGMGAALEFSIALTRLLKGDEAADRLSAAVLAK